MKLLGIDYGRRRIGLAVTDDAGGIPQGLPTLDRSHHPDILAALEKAVADHRPDTIVFGLPLDTQDNETEMCAEIRSFAHSLASRVHIPVEFTDESYSSEQAGFLLRSRKKKLRRKKELVDRISACLILNNYLKGRV
jgi:putative Holliday junction resolvase